MIICKSSLKTQSKCNVSFNKKKTQVLPTSFNQKPLRLLLSYCGNIKLKFVYKIKYYLIFLNKYETKRHNRFVLRTNGNFFLFYYD